MRAIMERFRRAPREPMPPVVPLEDVVAMNRVLELKVRSDVLTAAYRQCIRLGLDVDQMASIEDYVRFVYGQGWQACEKKMLAPDMADRIDLAMRTPAAVLEQKPGETLHNWIVRAVQQVVATEVPKG